ncbi:MAG TPA: hypothetical protein VF997_01090, partial [Polyangia bacterium]
MASNPAASVLAASVLAASIPAASVLAASLPAASDRTTSDPATSDLANARIVATVGVSAMASYGSIAAGGKRMIARLLSVAALVVLCATAFADTSAPTPTKGMKTTVLPDGL